MPRTRRTLLLALSAFSATIAALGLPDAGSEAPTDELVRVVIVSRHGVRTPTMKNSVLAPWAESPWPTWLEPVGELTYQGRRLARLMGEYDRDWLAAEGLLPSSGCPEPGSLVVYADVVQRTMDTAQALAGGLAAPGCGIPVLSRAPKPMDPLFHPVEAGACRLDPAVAERAVLQRARGGLDRFVAGYADSVAALQSVLRCCEPSLCRSFHLPDGCELGDLPTELAGAAPNAAPKLNGALSIGSDASEILLLEFADGKPADQVGWGRANAATIRGTLPLHDAAFDLIERTPYLARAAGSALLSQVAASLAGRAPAFVGPGGREGVRDAPVVFLVGHDTNIANLGGMLNASWDLPGYPTNETPPAGFLAFQLRRDRAGVESILVEYVSQSLEQMRTEAPLSLASPPLRVPVRMPRCTDGAAGRCTVAEFERAVARAIDPACSGGAGATPSGSPGSPAGATSATPSDTPARSSPPGR